MQYFLLVGQLFRQPVPDVSFLRRSADFPVPHAAGCRGVRPVCGLAGTVYLPADPAGRVQYQIRLVDPDVDYPQNSGGVVMIFIVLLAFIPALVFLSFYFYKEVQP